jgi:hypothetical protein
MILEALLIAAGSVVVTGAAIMTKDKDKIVQPTINNNINNSINNSFNKRIETTKTSTSSNIKKSHTTQQSTEIDHDKIIDELYLRYKLDKNADDLNKLMEELNNL